MILESENVNEVGNLQGLIMRNKKKEVKVECKRIEGTNNRSFSRSVNNRFGCKVCLFLFPAHDVRVVLHT